VVTPQLSTSIFSRSSIIDEPATAFAPSMPCSRRTVTSHKLVMVSMASPISFFTHLISPCWWQAALTLSVAPKPPPPRALVNRGSLSTLLVSLHRALPRRLLQGCAHLRPQPSACFQHLRAFRLTRSFVTRVLLSPVAKVCCRNCAPPSTCEWSLGACVCEWLKRLGLVRSVW
jgi:hypothetical protein